MTTTIFLLALMGTLGSVDGIYFHIFRYRLFAQPSAQTETLTHVLRGFTYSLGLAALLLGLPQGRWFWAVAAVFALDLLIDVIDVLLEPSSRAPLGGLSRPEYLVHMLVMAISGGIWTSFVVQGWPQRLAPTGLAPHVPGALPTWLVWDGWMLAAGAPALALLELTLLLRARWAKTAVSGS
jgi:hypothetical protein